MAYKYEPTQEELKIIQQGLYENESLNQISKRVDCSPKTVKVIIKDYGLDVSSYNPRTAHGKARRKNLTDEQLEEIVSLLREGVSLRKISTLYPVSLPTLKRILENNGITHNRYKRKSNKKFTLSAEEQREVKHCLSNGEKLKDLASRYGVSRNTLSAYLKECGILSCNEKLTEEQIQFIKDAHEEGIYANIIASIMMIEKSTVEKCIAEHCPHSITEKQKYKMNIKKKQNSLENLLKWFDKYYELSPESAVSKEHIQYVFDNINKYPFIDIVKSLNVDYEKLRRAIIVVGAVDIFTFDKLMSYSYKDKLLKDLSTSAYSNTMIAKKYGSTATTVSSWRKGLYGDTFSSYYNPSLSKSALEMEFELLLYSLKIAFIPEYRVDGMEFDYYIGHDILIELQGDYWHKGKEGKDEKKAEAARSKGYIVIQIPEQDFYENKSKYANLILTTYIEQISKRFG